MRITFVRPSITGTRSSDAMEPLVFSILTALTPESVELTLLDERLEPIPEDHQTDLVAMTVETYTARRAYQIASSFRRRGVPVVMGGYHPSFLPQEALCYADAVVVGDAEGLWKEIVEDAAAGRLKPIYRAAEQPPLAGVKFDRRLFKGKRYGPASPVQYGRGCKYACDFCSIHAFYGTKLRQRPVEEVVAEIEALDRRYLLLVDDNLFIDVPRTEALFRALVPLKRRWGCQVSIDVAKNTALLKLMQQSGCIAALIGFESLDEVNLASMNKKWNVKYGDYATAIRKFQDHGIMIYGSFIFGYDHDTTDVFDRTIEFALESKLFLCNFSALTPTPGARLYDRMQREGRLLYDRWWVDPDYRYGQATFQPRLMTAEQLTDGCLHARSEFYKSSSILRRAFDFQTNLRTPARFGIYMLANVMSRRELRHKLGHRLGTSAPLEPVLEAV